MTKLEQSQTLDHDIMWWEGKRIIVCCGHFCDRDGEVVND